MTLGELAVELTAETREFSSKMAEAAEAVEHTAKRVKRAAREIAMVGVELAAIGAEAVHAAAKSNPGTQRALDQLQRSFESIAAEIGQAALPILKEVGAAVKEVAEWFRHLDPALKQNAVRFAAIATAVLLGVGALGELSGVVAGVAAFVGMLSAPLVLVVGALAAGTLGVVMFRKAWQDGFQDMPVLVEMLLQPLINAARMFLLMKEAVSAIPAAFEAVGAAIRDAFVGSFEMAVDVTQKALVFILGLLDKVLQGAQAVAQLAHLNIDVGGARQTLATVTGVVGSSTVNSAAKNAGRAAIGGATSSLGDAVRAQIDAVLGGVGSAKDAAVKAGKDTVGWIASAIKEAGGDLKKLLAGLLKPGAGTPLSAEPLKLNDQSLQLGRSNLNQDLEKIMAALATSAAFSQFVSDMRTRAALTGASAPDTQQLAQQFAAEHAKTVSFTPTAQAQSRAMDVDLMSPFQKFANWLSDTWLSDVMAAMKSGVDTLQSGISAGLAVVGQGMTNALLSSGGAFSKTLQAAIKGFQQGGIGGAVAEGMVAMLSQSKQFQHILSILNAIFQLLADTFGALLAPLEPLFGAVFNVIRALSMILLPIFKMLAAVIQPVVPVIQLLANILQALAPVITVVAEVFQMIATPLMMLAGPVMKALFDVLKFAANVILTVVLAIAPIWNAILEALSSVFNTLASININLGPFGSINPFGFLQPVADAMKSAEIDTTALSESQKKLNSLTWDQAGAVAANTAAQLSNSAALNKATESLTNVPEGFKVALERFNSIAPGAGPNVYTGATPGSDNQGNPIVPHFASGGYVTGPTLAMIGEGGEPEYVTPASKMGAMGGVTVYANIYSNDPEEIYAKLLQKIQRGRFTRMSTNSRPAF